MHSQIEMIPSLHSTNRHLILSQGLTSQVKVPPFDTQEEHIILVAIEGAWELQFRAAMAATGKPATD